MDSGAFCIANISRKGQQRRYIIGVVLLAVSIWSGYQIITLGVPREWRLSLFLPLAVTVYTFLGAHRKT